MRKDLVTIKQAEMLKELGFNEPGSFFYDYEFKEINCCSLLNYNEIAHKHNWHRCIAMPSIDEAINWIRRKFNVQIYACIEPFVDPVEGPHDILHRYAVKWCNRNMGWNGRIYLGKSRLTKNIYSAKRECITLALRYVQKQERNKK